MHARTLLTAFILLGCRPRQTRPEALEDVPAADRTATLPSVPEVLVDSGLVATPDASVAVTAGPSVVALEGGVTLDPSSRARRPGEPVDRTVRSLSLGEVLAPTDLLRLGPRATVTVQTTTGGRVRLGGEAIAEVARYEGASLVVSRGVATVETAAEQGAPTRIDTPAGRLIVTGGSALVVVSEAGETLVIAAEVGATFWPSPPPPGARATALSAAERARLQADAGAHPILLDVDLADLPASLRPVRGVSLRAREVRAWDNLGMPSVRTPVLGARTPELVATQWLALSARAVAGLGAHLVAIGRLSRAGAGDLGDVRAALGLVASSRETVERDRMRAVASLALGRATARARRGRDLALRGGDVTALVQLSRLDELTVEAARSARP